MAFKEFLLRNLSVSEAPRSSDNVAVRNSHGHARRGRCSPGAETKTDATAPNTQHQPRGQGSVSAVVEVLLLSQRLGDDVPGGEGGPGVKGGVG